MNARTFHEPVAVLVGLGFARTIPNVMAAYQLVAEWPSSPRSPEHVDALEVCRACLNGEGKMEKAHAAFVKFADRAGILIADPLPVARTPAERHVARVAGPN